MRVDSEEVLPLDDGVSGPDKARQLDAVQCLFLTAAPLRSRVLQSRSRFAGVEGDGPDNDKVGH